MCIEHSQLELNWRSTLFWRAVLTLTLLKKGLSQKFYTLRCLFLLHCGFHRKLRDNACSSGDFLSSCTNLWLTVCNRLCRFECVEALCVFWFRTNVFLLDKDSADRYVSCVCRLGNICMTRNIYNSTFFVKVTLKRSNSLIKRTIMVIIIVKNLR